MADELMKYCLRLVFAFRTDLITSFFSKWYSSGFQPVGHRSILRWATELFEKLDIWLEKVLFDLQKFVLHFYSSQ